MNASVLVMRLVNVTLFVALVAALGALLPRGRRAPLVWGATIVSVPLGMFLVPSLNPSSWAIASGVMLWVAYAQYLRETNSRRRVVFAAFALVAAVMGAGARADSAIYNVIAIGAVSILLVERTRRFWISSLLG